MPLYEFYCESCQHRFEQVTSAKAVDYGQCPRCQKADQTRRLISRFAVGGQGDLRESTLHGCHGEGDFGAATTVEGGNSDSSSGGGCGSGGCGHSH